MNDLKRFEVWFVTGSQNLYGPETLEQVAAHSREMAGALSESAAIPVNIVFKPILTSPEEIRALCLEANSNPACIGLITWMHTFSPAKMWIAGLNALQKPFLHLHTQYNRELPWAEIDMDFMNLNQSAHGDREFGFIASRLRLNRKVVVGHWQDADVQASVGNWSRSASAWADWQVMKIARFGENMREVAVTEGDKVEAQRRLGFSVNAYGVGDVAAFINEVSEREIDQLINEYLDLYQVVPELRPGGERFQFLREGARQEAGIRHFLDNGGFTGFTTTFEDLHGLHQLPGLAAQRLMADGYGYGAEGDWKSAAMVRAMKVMSTGLTKGTSFMEDYTYHFTSAGLKILGAHMLEVCPSIADARPKLEIHPLSIGGKADPVRLVFDAKTGPAVAACIVDVGSRFRMVVNAVESVPLDQPLPKLPVARALWEALPDAKTAATAWIQAGGAHHTSFSLDLTPENMEDFAGMAGVEFLLIDKDTRLAEFKKEIRWNDLYYHLAKGI
ncbi:MAG TPA: L-arabinose isomerase [Chloroflexia bacterium]|nr:L-arabinose isomerase [Chloroflexia bacterium]